MGGTKVFGGGIPMAPPHLIFGGGSTGVILLTTLPDSPLTNGP